MKRYTVLALFLIGLSGCLFGPQIPPSTQSLGQIKSILVIPLEAPPLEAASDLILAQQPALAMLSETIPLALVLDHKAYQGPGGMLIFGMTDKASSTDKTPTEQSEFAAMEPVLTESSKANAGAGPWIPTEVLAQQIVSQLSSGGTVKAILREHSLPLADRGRNTHIQDWKQPIRQWYNQETSSVDYGQSEKEGVDAVLEVGIGGYSLSERHMELELLMKLVDPSTKRALGRTRNQSYQALGPGQAQSLLAGNGEGFKQLVSQMGNRLVTDNLDYFKLVPKGSPAAAHSP